MSSDAGDDAVQTDASAEPKPRRRRKPRRKERTERPPATSEGPARGWSERAIRLVVLFAGAAALTGIALVGTHESAFGAFLVVGGMVTLIASIHKLGRLGPDVADGVG